MFLLSVCNLLKNNSRKGWMGFELRSLVKGVTVLPTVSLLILPNVICRKIYDLVNLFNYRNITILMPTIKISS